MENQPPPPSASDPSRRTPTNDRAVKPRRRWTFFLLGMAAELVLLVVGAGAVGYRVLTASKSRWGKFAELHLEASKNYLASIPKMTEAERRNAPNIVVILTDDLGYADVSGYGARAIKTPHIDALAKSGVAFTHGLAAAPLCSPSRFGLLTGRYSARGLITNVYMPTVPIEKDDAGKVEFFNDGAVAGEEHPMPSAGGINRRLLYFLANLALPTNGLLHDEVTLAEILAARGYRTSMLGKWHLGDHSPSLPNDKGFEQFYGCYFSVDMVPFHIFRNRDLVERKPDMGRLTQDFTREALAYVDAHAGEPFFLYYASPYPHYPAAASRDFRGKSAAGTYGDSVEEIDWSVGRLVDKLKEKGILDNTIIVFTSDNGPWFQGSPGDHRGRKDNTLDGGQVVPFIVSWPKHIPGGRVAPQTVISIDLLPTLLRVVGVDLPRDRVIDGIDILPLLEGKSTGNPHPELFYVHNMAAHAVLTADNYKYYASASSENSSYTLMGTLDPFLTNLSNDADESYDLRDLEPAKAESLRNRLAAFNRELQTNPRGWK